MPEGVMLGGEKSPVEKQLEAAIQQRNMMTQALGELLEALHVMEPQGMTGPMILHLAGVAQQWADEAVVEDYVACWFAATEEYPKPSIVEREHESHDGTDYIVCPGPHADLLPKPVIEDDENEEATP